eukprot:scaffold1599_cov115-Cylindrotheca_fusiformis.AAC.2
MTRKTNLSMFPDNAECTVRDNESSDHNILSPKALERRRRIKLLALSSFLILALIAIVSTLVLWRTSESSGPTESPSQNPSQSPSEHPTSFPSNVPSDLPSGQPSIEPSFIPSTFPSKGPSGAPTMSPTSAPTRHPTAAPTARPSVSLSPTVSVQPSSRPSDAPLNAIFYVIGDIPYTPEEKESLIQHVDTLPDDAEFLVHVGDIRTAEDRANCTFAEFDMVANILKSSPVPVFIVPGACPNTMVSYALLQQTMSTTTVPTWQRAGMIGKQFLENLKRVLYIGLNIVGGKDTDIEEWETRLDHDWKWTKHLVETYVLPQSSVASAVVIFAHADPNHAHATFFDPLREFIKVELNNRIPFLYVNGDGHYFQFDSDFYGQSNFHRIMVEGGSTEPPLKLSVSVPPDPDHQTLQVEDIYDYDRFLEVE